MSSLKTDAIEAATGTNTNLALTGKGTGKVALGDAALLVPDADGAAGQILTTDGSLALTFAATPGTSGNVLTSNGSAWTSAAAAGGGAWTVIGTAVASASASIEVSGIDTTYDYYAVGGAELVSATDSVQGRFRVGTSSAVNESNYSGAVMKWHNSSDSFSGTGQGPGRSQLDFPDADNWGNDTGENHGFMMFWTSRNDSLYTIMHGTMYGVAADGVSIGGLALMKLDITAVIDRVNWSYASGNVASGRLTVWGINHA